MRFANIYDSMLNQVNIYLKWPLISTKNELQISGSFWMRLHLEKTAVYLGGGGGTKQICYSGVNTNYFVNYNSHIDCVAGLKYVL
jgi:hypothetical protein